MENSSPTTVRPRNRNTAAVVISIVLLVVTATPFVMSLFLPGLVSGSQQMWVTPVAWGSLVALSLIAVVMSARGRVAPKISEDHARQQGVAATSPELLVPEPVR